MLSKTNKVAVQATEDKNLSKWRKFGVQWVFVLILMFFFAFVSLLPSTARYHVDEQYFTNAAIRMVQTGDYFTPYYYEGTLQLKKPILAYWAVAASYKIFGINFFSSRIPFLVAGCIIIWITYKFALLLFRREEDAVIAAAIIASNFTLFHISIRSTYDTFFCLFITMSLYGFARLIFNRDKRIASYIFAYVGAGLAVATHGMWGALPVFFSFLFCFFRTGDTVKLRELIDVKSIVIAVFIASFWYVIAWYRHGDVFIQQFFGDQLVGRWSGFRMHIVGNMLAYLLAPLRQFLPWSAILLLVVVRDKKGALNFFREHKKIFLFIVGLYLTYYVIFSAGNIQRTRYFFPTYPLIAILYSALLVFIAKRGHVSSLLRTIERWLMLTGLSGGCLLALAGLFFDIRLAVGGLIAIFVSAALYASLSRRSAVFGLMPVALCLIMLFSVSENFVRPVFYNSPAPLVVKKVREYTQGPIEIAGILYYTDPRYIAQIYVLSGGYVKVDTFDESIASDKLKQFQFIILPEPVKDKINLDEYSVEECGYTYKEGVHFKVRSLWSIRKIDDIRALLSEFQQPYYFYAKKQHKDAKEGNRDAEKKIGKVHLSDLLTVSRSERWESI
jgi:4-amino-4-deoxy-L-arabinose transferase-like glycosyltransferase